MEAKTNSGTDRAEATPRAGNTELRIKSNQGQVRQGCKVHSWTSFMCETNPWTSCQKRRELKSSLRRPRYTMGADVPNNGQLHSSHCGDRGSGGQRHFSAELCPFPQTVICRKQVSAWQCTDGQGLEKKCASTTAVGETHHENVMDGLGDQTRQADGRSCEKSSSNHGICWARRDLRPGC